MYQIDFKWPYSPSNLQQNWIRVYLCKTESRRRCWTSNGQGRVEGKIISKQHGGDCEFPGEPLPGVCLWRWPLGHNQHNPHDACSDIFFFTLSLERHLHSIHEAQVKTEITMYVLNECNSAPCELWSVQTLDVCLILPDSNRNCLRGVDFNIISICSDFSLAVKPDILPGGESTNGARWKSAKLSNNCFEVIFLGRQEVKCEHFWMLWFLTKSCRTLRGNMDDKKWHFCPKYGGWDGW